MAEVQPPTEGNGLPLNGSNGTDSAPARPVSGNAPTDGLRKDTDDVMYSDIGLTTLLDRLKQSIASAREFSTFLKKRSAIEDDHAKGLMRLAKTTEESLRNSDFRQGSYARQMQETMRMHERLANNGTQFSLSLHQMHEDLIELTNNMERGRKQWKHDGLSAEKKASDAEALMTRAKTKYDGLAEDYDRAKTGDVKGSRKFMKGPKSAAQYEEDVLRKLQMSDTDYQEKVNAAKAQRNELINTTRPRAVRAIQELIRECDSAVTLQLQKFATFNEKLFLANGMLITPLPQEGANQKSLRDIVAQVDNDHDFHSYLLAQKSKVPRRKGEIEYTKHPSLAPRQQMPAPASTRQPASSFNAQPQSQPQQPPPPQIQQSQQPPPSQFQPSQQSQPPLPQPPPAPHSADDYGQPSQHGRTFSYEDTAPPPPQYSHGPSQDHYQGGPSAPQSMSYPNQGMRNSSGAPAPPGPQYNEPPYPESPAQKSLPPGPGLAAGQGPSSGPMPLHNGPSQQRNGSPMGGPAGPTGLGAASGPPPPSAPSNTGPPTRPVFGVDLEELFQRDGSAVPMVVYQCMQAVDLFGLSVEGIYRQNGTAQHIQQLKALFDNDASRVDFRNPATFHHDVNSVAGLLKQFFRDLPDPLLTRDRYGEFISAARIDDDVVRRDTLHAIINGLPDANYATLRAVVLHLHRVQEHQSQNRMSSSNLAICFAPSLMGVNGGTQIQDSALQARVVDTILINTYQIFDED